MSEDINIKEALSEAFGDALREYEQEKVSESQKEAAEVAISSELGFRAYMKEAGITEPDEQEAFMEAARQYIAATEG